MNELQQINIQIIADLGINLVTCGNCGRINQHKAGAKIDEIKCIHCGLKEDICHFPDLFY